MRKKSSILNVSSNITILFTQTILSFITRIVFIRILGEECLGLEGLFVNIVSMFSLAELGVTTAISYNLYKPLAENDVKKINVLMSLYKRIYICVGISILIIGSLLIPFLGNFITDYHINNLVIIYVLYIIDSSLTYLITYKEVLIISDQKNYKIAIHNFLSSIFTYGFQIVFLICYKNFVIYLLIQILVRLIQRILINKYISSEYSNIDFNCKEKLSRDEKKDIVLNIKSMFFQKIGNFLINGTDSIIISKFINISTVGIYSNYLSITTILKNLVNSVSTGITASFGNLVAKEDKNIQINVFEIVNFISFLLNGFITLNLLILVNPFIEFCFGTKYILEFGLVLIISLNFYISSMLAPLDSVKSASGIYVKDRFVPLIQSIVNLFFSLFLVNKIGLYGVLFGTLISYIVISVWNRPYIVYKYAFNSKPYKYYIEYIYRFLLLIICYIIISFVISGVFIDNFFLELIVKGTIVFTIYSFVILITHFKNKEFKYICLELRNIIRKIGVNNGKRA